MPSVEERKVHDILNLGNRPAGRLSVIPDRSWSLNNLQIVWLATRATLLGTLLVALQPQAMQARFLGYSIGRGTLTGIVAGRG